MATEPLKDAIQLETARFEQFYHWLETSMPKIFFNEVSAEWIALIVHSLMGFEQQECFTQIHLKNAAISLSLDAPGADVKILQSFPFYAIKNYTTYVSREPLPFGSTPQFLRVATLHFTEPCERCEEPLSQASREEIASFLSSRHLDWSPESIDQLIDQMDVRFIRKMPLERKLVALEMFERARQRDACQYTSTFDENWEAQSSPSMHLILAWKNVPKHNFLYRFARLVHRHGLVMQRVNAAYIEPYKVNNIFMLSLSLHGAEGKAAWETADLVDFLQEMVTMKMFEGGDLIDETFVQTRLLRGNLANFLRTSINFIHQVLVSADPNLYNLENIEEALCRHPELTIKLCSAFEYKFHPLHANLELFEKEKSEFIERVHQLDTGHTYHDVRRKNILLQGMNFTSHILKTNFYRNNKTAFTFRLDPNYLDFVPFERKNVFPELPFGIFYVRGMLFIAFHIRFKDLSRGGLRTVYPKRKERMLAERNTVFSECYNLAYTQNQKNKDIPEGGAKAVIFLEPYAHLAGEAAILSRELKEAGKSKEEIDETIAQFIAEQELEYLYQTQRAFIKGLITLVNCDPDGTLRAKHIVDYWKKPEYIYLGPDENLHDSMIVWIAEESKNEHYRPGGAFISGKPKIGINHKEYGVTSLGVNVYMEQMLRHLKIDPTTQAFTLKMTGGPDGDVAGNQILNLYRFYPNTAKLIALTDVSGTIYDPEGLDLKTCVELFETGRSIRHYPPVKLSTDGFLLDRESKKEISAYEQKTLCWRKHEKNVVSDWMSSNEANHLFRSNVHQTKADLFIPCGGRPRTLNESNYKDFFDKAGEPTARAIIEGANLYLSQSARVLLEQAGVLIIKDSSANKGGVICSSFEILCSLCLSDAEFLEYKAPLVVEILERVKRCALNEANLLLAEYQNSKKPLTELSDEVSRRINYFTDQLLAHFETVTLSDDTQDPMIQAFLSYCPKTLREGFQDRLMSHIPDNHKKAVIASHIASCLVYQRGMSWFPSLIDILPILLSDVSLALRLD